MALKREGSNLLVSLPHLIIAERIVQTIFNEKFLQKEIK